MNRRNCLISMCLLVAFATGAVHASGGRITNLKKGIASTHHVIAIEQFRYSSVSLDAALGDKITWKNNDIVPHTATAENGSWDTGELKYGETYSLIVVENMGLYYYCRFHPIMAATLQLVQ